MASPATLRSLQRACNGAEAESRTGAALRRLQQRQARADADADAEAEAAASARYRTEAAAAYPAPPAMVSVGQRVPLVLAQPWPSLSERRAAVPLASATPAVHRFWQYVLRMDGVRCERHMSLLTRTPLPLASFPPLHLYPHGVRQRTAVMLDAGPVDLTDEQLDLAERVHLHSFCILHARGGGGALSLLEQSSLESHSHSPFPSAPPSGRACWRSDTAAPKHYMLLPCVRKSDAELAVANAEQWSFLDEHDSLRMSDLEVQRELQWQMESRDSLTQGHGGRCSRPPASQQTMLDDSDTPQTSSALDWDFMRSLLSPPSPRAVADPAAVSSAPPRSLLLWTPYNDRLYTNLSEHVAVTGNSPFPNKEYVSYTDFYRRKWGVDVPDPSLPLIAAANFALAPLNVLQPALLPHKKRQSREPTILLLPAATRVLDVSPQWLHVLRLLPCVLHRIETHLLHAELAHALALPVPLRPFPLRMALTAPNAQESYPLPFAPDHPCSAAMLQAAEDATSAAAASLFSSLSFFTPAGTPPSISTTTTATAPLAPPSPTIPFSYDRLKFVGDSALKLVLTKLLLVRHQDEAEEDITRRKSLVLNARCMAAVALRANLQRFVVAHPFHPAQFRPPGFAAATPGVDDVGSWLGGGSLAASASSSGAAANPTSVVSAHVLADLVSSLVGCAWMSGGEARCAAMMVALGVIDLAAIHRFNALPVPRDAELDPFADHPRVKMLLTSQNECERIIGYQFRNRTLYVQTFWHERWSSSSGGDGVSSASGVDNSTAAPRYPSYERLELLGDAVLELCVSSAVCAIFTRTGSPGDLTFLRQKLVSNQVLATAMRHSHLHPFIEPAAANAQNTPPPKLLADVLEALLGAVYVDSECSLAVAWRVYLAIVEVSELNPHTQTVRIQHG